MDDARIEAVTVHCGETVSAALLEPVALRPTVGVSTAAADRSRAGSGFGSRASDSEPSRTAAR